MPCTAMPVQHLIQGEPVFLHMVMPALGNAEPLHGLLRGTLVVGITFQLQGSCLRGALEALRTAAGAITPSCGSGLIWITKAG